MIAKFKKGDKVLVHGFMETVINRVILGEDGEYEYWFRDESGKHWWDLDNAIELIKTK